jgi:hypothetical protein
MRNEREKQGGEEGRRDWGGSPIIRALLQSSFSPPLPGVSSWGVIEDHAWSSRNESRYLRAIEAARRKSRRTCAQPFAKCAHIRIQGRARTCVELGQSTVEQACCRFWSSDDGELVKGRRDLDEALKAEPRHCIGLDSPAVLPCFVSFEERSGVEEEGSAPEGVAERLGHVVARTYQARRARSFGWCDNWPHAIPRDDQYDSPACSPYVLGLAPRALLSLPSSQSPPSPHARARALRRSPLPGSRVRLPARRRRALRTCIAWGSPCRTSTRRPA